MKNVFKIIYIILTATFFTGCKKDFLSFPYTDGNLTIKDIFSSDRNARGFLNSTYNGLNDRYGLYDGQMLASGSDEAVSSDNGSINPVVSSRSVNAFNNGSWSPTTVFDAQYNNMYDFIRRTNIFLENSLTSNIGPRSDIGPLRGEAYFLRAFYHFQLFERYGRIVLATHSFIADENLKNLERDPVEKVVKQIADDCDSAVSLIRDSAIVDQGDHKGRATQMSALALKSRVLLYGASPLSNTSGDKSKWTAAADAARKLISYNKHSLVPFADINNIWNFQLRPYNSEVIFGTAPQSVNDIEKNNAPVSYDAARGRNNPTQDLVDAFEMKTGKSITDAGSGYDPQNPYANRDPRLAAFVMYNHTSTTIPSKFKNINVETFIGGKDNKTENINSTVTGYYLRKFLTELAAWPATGTQTRIPRTWVFFRYAEILLNAAEAVNEAEGPTAEALNYLNQVRTRAQMPAITSGTSQTELRERIQNERRVELCFEEHRFFDVRRWKLGELFNKPVKGVKITKNTNNTFSYIYVDVDNRVFSEKNYLFPIPQSELNIHPKLGQNLGW